jgi:hypothetical protein
MQKLADISQFEALCENSSSGSQLSAFNPAVVSVENLDLISEPSPASSAHNPPPGIPEWGTSLGERVTRLERTMGKVAMADKVEAGFAEVRRDMKQELVGMKQEIVNEVKTLLQRR